MALHNTLFALRNVVLSSLTYSDFVVQWNNHGYDIAKWMGHKFTHVSPVWLQLRHNTDMKYKITGTHDVDAKWMREVKRKGPKSKIFPL